MRYIDTIKFLRVATQQKEYLPFIEHIELISRTGERFQTDVYQPVNSKKIKGTILFIHGMNKYGNKDPRMVALCQASAAINYRAIAPTYDLIAKHLVDLQSVDDFIDTIKLIATNKTLCEGGRLGIFTASLSGTYSLRAAANKEAADLVTSLCSVGICFNPRTTFTNILKAKSYDHYAKYIAIKSLFHMNNELNETLRKGLDFAIDDEYEMDKLERVKQYLATLHGADQQQLAEIMAAVESGKDLSIQYENLIENIHRVMTEAYDMHGLKCYTTLIHSKNDQVLPTTETELLYQQLKEYGKPCKMLITPVLEHANTQFRIKNLIEILKFINACHCFFKHI